MCSRYCVRLPRKGGRIFHRGTAQRKGNVEQALDNLNHTAPAVANAAQHSSPDFQSSALEVELPITF